MMLQNPSFEEFVGHTQKQKTLDQIYNYIQEDRAKSLGYLQKYVPLSLMTAFNPDTEEITSIGCSVPNDIINDNFGELFAKILAGSLTPNTLLDITNTVRTLRSRGNASDSANGPFTLSSLSGDNYGFRVQVGTGTTPPTRQDFNIETPFANGGPEDNIIFCNLGSFIVANNTVQVGKVIAPTNGNGTVRESCLFIRCKDATTALTGRTFVLSRDLVTINFLIGQSISVSYVWTT